MFSDDCAYVENAFRMNESGVAVMYTRRVRMAGNTFERNWGGAAYGLLLKDISDSEVLDNRFIENTVGLYLEGANRNQVSGNLFQSNGWGLRLLANAQDNRVADNTFVGNSFDVERIRAEFQHVHGQLVGSLSRLRSGSRRLRRRAIRAGATVRAGRGADAARVDPSPEYRGRPAGLRGTCHAHADAADACR
jgi:parallel beta-helix repeat protein